MNIFKSIFCLCASIQIFLFGNYVFAQQLKTDSIISENGEKLYVKEGKLTLPESRTSVASNSIILTYQVLETKSRNPRPPVFLLAGGPGGSWLNTAHLNERFSEIKFYSQYSDVVIFDQRGAGRSYPNLQCDEEITIPQSKKLSLHEVKSALRDIAVKCRDYWINKGIDLKSYNTHESVMDLDDLRKALGYDEIILIGGSYGSHLGLHYLRTFEKQVNRAVFYGIEGPDHTWDKPNEVLNAIKRIASETEKSEYYANRIPQGGLIKMYDEIYNKILIDEKLSPLVAQFIFRFNAGNQYNLSAWPDNLLALKEGDYSFAKAVEERLRTVNSPNAMSEVMDFSSWISEKRKEKILNDPDSIRVGNINLSYTVKEHLWPIIDLGDSFRRNVSSDKPVLLIHGDWDLNTPIENAREVHSSLSNSNLIEVIHGSHDALYDLFEEWDPIYRILSNFIQDIPQEVPKRVVLPLHFPDVFDSNQIAFWNAVIKGDLGETKKSFSNGVQIDLLDTRKSKTGRTAMNWAAWHDHPHILEFLLKQGADVNFQNKSGYTPLHHAIENCSMKSIQFLLKNGADVSLKTHKDLSPPEIANRNCQEFFKIISN